MKPPLCKKANEKTGWVCALYAEHKGDHKTDHLKESWSDESASDRLVEPPRDVSEGSDKLIFQLVKEVQIFLDDFPLAPGAWRRIPIPREFVDELTAEERVAFDKMVYEDAEKRGVHVWFNDQQKPPFEFVITWEDLRRAPNS